MAISITSSAFAPGGNIPTRFTCEGADTSVPIAWSGAPAGTKSYALIVDDPDAPDPEAPKMTYVQRGRHRHFFKVYALDSLLGDLGAPTKPALLAAVDGHVLAHGELMGTYQKQQ